MDTLLEERRRPAHSLPNDLDVRLKRVLVVIDDTEQTGRALDYVISHAGCRAPVDAVLLYVRPSEQRGATRGDLNSSEVWRDCEPVALRSAAHRLDHVGIVHRERIAVGDLGTAIVTCAEEESCDLIVLADTKRGPSGDPLERRAGLAVRSVLKQAANRSASIQVVIVK